MPHQKSLATRGIVVPDFLAPDGGTYLFAVNSEHRVVAIGIAHTQEEFDAEWDRLTRMLDAVDSVAAGAAAAPAQRRLSLVREDAPAVARVTTAPTAPSFYWPGRERLAVRTS